MPIQRAINKSLRRGFTLVELLVVIAIIGILVGLLLPAIQTIRESARRNQCMNNVRQLSLAAVNYEAAHMHFPAGVVDDDDNLRDAIRVGWVDLLPHLEQDNLYRQYDLDSNWKSATNAELATVELAILRCPASQGDFDQFGSVVGALSDYAMCKGPSASLARKSRFQMGVFDVNSDTRFTQIRDGSSNVFLIGEAVSERRIEGRGL